MAPAPNYPGVYVEEISSGVRTIKSTATSICAFVGRTQRGPLANTDGPVAVYSFNEFERVFGALHPDLSMGQVVRDFFINGGGYAVILRLCHADVTPSDEGSEVAGPALSDADYLGDLESGTGLHALRRVDLFNLLCIPADTPQGDTAPAVYQAALQLCVERRAILLVDPPVAWTGVSDIVGGAADGLAALELTGSAARNAAIYFPRLLQRLAGPTEPPTPCVPCGAVAGVIARTDTIRGVWKAPAGVDATIIGIAGLVVQLSDDKNGLLNPVGINALRGFPGYGNVIWGARTLRGDDISADEYKYLPVRRLALHIEESVSRGIAWAAFEPNDEALWAQLRLNVNAFMYSLFRQGAFHGASAQEAWFVRCDAQTHNRNDLDRGICNMTIGFAPLKPAEFVVLRLSQATSSAPV